MVLLTSTLTTLCTQAVKQHLDEKGKTYSSNLVAGIVAVVMGIAIGLAWVEITCQPYTAVTFITVISLIFLSWLCAMLGYDKVIQTLKQIIAKKGNDES